MAEIRKAGNKSVEPSRGRLAGSPRGTTSAWIALGTVAVLGMGALHSGPADAQTSTDEWRFGGALYGYFPSLSAETAFPTPSGGSIDVNADKLIRHLKFAFMGSLEAEKGRYGAFTDIMYFNVGGSRSGTRDLAVSGIQLPVGVTADASLDVKAWVWTIAGTYRLVSTPEVNLDAFAGARMLNVKSNLDWEFSADVGPFSGPFRKGSAEASLTNWDGIVGVKGRFNLGADRRWFVPYYADVGAGDSQRTWQAATGLGYAFSWGEVIAGWRYLDYNFKSTQKLENLSFNGPAVGVAFHW